MRVPAHSAATQTMKLELTEDQRILMDLWGRLISLDSNTRQAAQVEALRLPLAQVPRPDTVAIPLTQLRLKAIWFALFFVPNSFLSMYLCRRYHLPDWDYLVFAFPSLLWLCTLYFRIV